MVTNFVVVVIQEEDEGVSAVHPFPALVPAKKRADKLALEERPPYDIVVWDIAANAPAYSPYNNDVDPDTPEETVEDRIRELVKKILFRQKGSGNLGLSGDTQAMEELYKLVYEDGH